jgi:hypothetical protein
VEVAGREGPDVSPLPTGLLEVARAVTYNRSILAADSVAGAVAPSSVSPDRVERSDVPPLMGAAFDFFLLGPGATLAVSALFLALWAAGRPTAAAAVATTLSLLVLGPHYAATYRRAFFSLDVLRAHPVVTLVAPIFLVAGAALAVSSPRFGPWYFLAYVAWSGYHYSGQSLGIAMLFPLRQRARLDAREKRLLALPLYASWILSLIGLLRVGAGARNPAYSIVAEAFLPVHLSTAALLALLMPLAATFAGPIIVARERRRRGTPLPAMSLAVLATQVVWFAIGVFHPFFNVVLVPVFHSLQYLALTGWHWTRGERGGRLAPFAAYVLSVLVLGLVINPGLLAIFVPNDSTPRTLSIAAAVISAINLHHFLMDGRIWRMRERRVAQAFGG